MNNQIDPLWDARGHDTEILYEESDEDYGLPIEKKTWTATFKWISEKTRTAMVTWTRTENGPDSWEAISMPQIIEGTPAAKTDYEMAQLLRESAEYIEININN